MRVSQAKEVEVTSPNKTETKADTQKHSSKGSTTRVLPKGTPLVESQVLESLSDGCFWLHTCVMGMDSNETLTVRAEKVQFHYLEDTAAYITKVDVREFLRRKKLNVSIIQGFMR